MKEIDDTLYSQHDRSDGKAWGRREKKKLTRYNEKRKEKKWRHGSNVVMTSMNLEQALLDWLMTGRRRSLVER